MLLTCGVGEDSWKSFGLQGDPTSQSHWKDWCWSWNSNTLATWCDELTHWKRSWCWERLKAGGEGDDRGWDGWVASLTGWTWVWVSSGSWWWTAKPGELQSMGSKRIGHDWVTELNWFSYNKWRNSIGKIPDCLHGAQSWQQREIWAYLIQNCQEERVSCQGFGCLMAGRDHVRPSRERWHGRGEWKLDLRNLVFCFRESGTTWCSLKQHPCCLGWILS